MLINLSKRVGIVPFLWTSPCSRSFSTPPFDIYHLNHNRNEKETGKITPIYKICLTGGPCSGKTTAVAKITNLIEKKGFRVFNVPEAATLLMKSGAMIQNKK